MKFALILYFRTFEKILRMLKKIIFFFFLFITYNFNAQSKTQLKEIKEDNLTITMSSDIYSSLKQFEGKSSSNETNKSDNEESSKTENKIAKQIETENKETSVERPKLNHKKLTNNELCAKNPRILGYKILINTVHTKEEADEISTEFRKTFPYLKTFIDASLRPNYKILAGSYFYTTNAAEDLKKIRAFYKTAKTVKYMIFCTDAL